LIIDIQCFKSHKCITLVGIFFCLKWHFKMVIVIQLAYFVLVHQLSSVYFMWTRLCVSYFKFREMYKICDNRWLPPCLVYLSLRETFHSIAYESRLMSRHQDLIFTLPPDISSLFWSHEMDRVSQAGASSSVHRHGRSKPSDLCHLATNRHQAILYRADLGTVFDPPCAFVSCPLP
jgi:hypothetical protein